MPKGIMGWFGIVLIAAALCSILPHLIAIGVAFFAGSAGERWLEFCRR